MINMKTNLTKQKCCLLSILFMMLFTVKGFSQANNYNIYLTNLVQTAPNQMELDVVIEWTGTNTQKLTFMQAGINFNHAGMANGGIITGAFVAGSAGPGTSVVQQTPNWNINQTSKQIRFLASIASEGLATAIPPPPGYRLGKFRITNTVPFTTSSSPNFVWAFLTGTSTTTKSQVSVYVNGATTGTDVTIPANHFTGNIILNPPCPTANAGGPYSSCGDVQLNGSAANQTSVSWTSPSGGVFTPNNTVLNPIYTPTERPR